MPTKPESVIDLQSKYTSKTGGKLAEGEEGFPEGVEVEVEAEPELDAGLLNMVL